MLYIAFTESLFMRNSGCVNLFLILCLFFGLFLCAGCTQKDGASPLVTGTPGVPVPPASRVPAHQPALAQACRSGATAGVLILPRTWGTAGAA
jgi:hypothetical protein